MEARIDLLRALLHGLPEEEQEHLLGRIVKANADQVYVQHPWWSQLLVSAAAEPDLATRQALDHLCHHMLSGQDAGE